MSHLSTVIHHSSNHQAPKPSWGKSNTNLSTKTPIEPFDLSQESLALPQRFKEPEGSRANGKSSRPESDFGYYLKAINKVPLLTAEDEKELGRKLADAQAAFEEAVCSLPCLMKALNLIMQAKIQSAGNENGSLRRIKPLRARLDAALKNSAILFEQNGRLSKDVLTANGAIIHDCVNELAAARHIYRTTQFKLLLTAVHSSHQRLQEHLKALAAKGLTAKDLLPRAESYMSANAIQRALLAGKAPKYRLDLASQIEADCQALEDWQKENLLTLSQSDMLERLRFLEARCAETRNKLVCANFRLVVNIATKTIKRNGLWLGEIEDLVAEGNVGLIKAAERFDPWSGNKFSTFATSWIKQFIGRACERRGLIPRPRTARADKVKLDTAKAELMAFLGREPSADELAARLGWKVRKVREISLGLKDHPQKAILALPEPDDGNLLELIATDDSALARQQTTELKESSEKICALANRLLTPREKMVLALRLGLNLEGNNLSPGALRAESLTLEEASIIMRVSRERVRQLETGALRLLRNYVLVAFLDNRTRSALINKLLPLEIDRKLVQHFFSEKPLNGREARYLLFRQASPSPRSIKQLMERRNTAVRVLAAYISSHPELMTW